jgi:ribosomal protein S18 acetylase RimI-like enzyme
MRSSHPLDNPVWHAIASAQRGLIDMATRESLAAGRFQSDVCPFGGLSDPLDPRCWAALEELLMGQTVALIIGADMVPSNWEIVRAIDGVQLDGTNLRDEVDDSLTVLQAADVPDMLDLVERTQPGPFLPRTIEMGTYVGLHHEGRLVAMAGERLRPPGWTEISAVCTDAAVRHQGIGTRLVRAVAAGVRERGDLPFLHAAATNASAIRLYLSLGFVLRRTVTFTVLRTA